ncbi:HK97 family phage prohead protease [Antribacter gilvus]|uniref:HK97 family phage prohead protease n=1 Tax=Antribacter gilvus TaxID=2304675 RepID=UPI000F7BAD3F|nr:HK97 family phage prohead protease [Antribacter gilvus]
MTEAERRFTSVAVETRAGKTNAMTIGGYAAKFDRMSQNLGGFVERIAPTFFNKSRGDGWPGVIARYNHDDNMVLGTSRAGTLRLGLDEIGLAYDVELPSSRADVYELVQRGDVAQSSFAFIVFEDDWTQSDQGFPLRTLVSGRLLDVAPVNTPAYEDTSVVTRGALDSLARKFDADPAEVRQLAQANELSRFFKRTDAPSDQERRRSAQAALAKVMSLR